MNFQSRIVTLTLTLTFIYFASICNGPHADDIAPCPVLKVVSQMLGADDMGDEMGDFGCTGGGEVNNV